MCGRHAYGEIRSGCLALAGALAATIIAAACLATPASGSVQPPLGAASAARPASAARSAQVAQASAATVPALSGPVVALGDSYTAGALLPADLKASPLGCLRSTKAYPELVAARARRVPDRRGLRQRRGPDMTAAQQTNLGTNPPQLNALAPDDSLVLLTLGGDDLGFMNVLDKCMELSFTDPWGSPCEAYYTKGGTDQLAAAVRAEAPRMAAVLAAIAARAPQARIVVVGYPDLFPLSGGCWPAVPITDGDIAYLRGIELQLNAMLAADARAANATFVNAFTPTIGHDFCQPESDQGRRGPAPRLVGSPVPPQRQGPGGHRRRRPSRPARRP